MNFFMLLFLLASSPPPTEFQTRYELPTLQTRPVEALKMWNNAIIDLDKRVSELESPKVNSIGGGGIYFEGSVMDKTTLVEPPSDPTDSTSDFR